MILIISIMLVGSVLLLNIWKEIPIANMTRDIVTSAEVPIYTGFFSQIGIFFWIATATLCLFSASIKGSNQENLRLKRFLFISGLVTMLLCLDDIFLLHEVVYPYMGIPEKVVYGIYGIVIISWGLKFNRIILQTDYILLLLAFFFFALSIFLDVFPIPDLNPFLWEDGFKMAGIISWFFYFSGNSVRAVSDAKSD